MEYSENKNQEKSKRKNLKICLGTIIVITILIISIIILIPFEQKEEKIDPLQQQVIDELEEAGYKVDIVWENYCEEDFNSAYWGKENRKFTSDFIMKAAARYKKCRLELKVKKIKEMKDDIIKLQKELDDGVD